MHLFFILSSDSTFDFNTIDQNTLYQCLIVDTSNLSSPFPSFPHHPDPILSAQGSIPGNIYIYIYMCMINILTLK